MLETSAQTIIKHIVDGDDFITIANSVCDEYIAEYGTDSVELLQISPEGDKLTLIAGNANGANVDIGSEIDYDPDRDTGENEIYVPIFIRNQVAMYLHIANKDRGISSGQQAGLTKVALVLQNVASKKNFEDSLENSYKLLGDILDEVPSGIIVLDNVNKDVLFMNKTAARSEAVQRAIGAGLSRYVENKEPVQEGIYEEESGFWYDVTFSNISWMDSRTVLMATTVDVTQKVKNQQRIEYQANNDYLTGLFNRLKCESDLKHILEESAENNERGILIYLDLDDFKQVNDGLGHQYGDVLLQEIANGITSIPQISNSCYRMGGDEFVIIVKPQVFSEVTGIVEQICTMFNSPWNLLGVDYVCTMSMGLAIYPDNATHAHELLKKADFAMYEAKKGGKNRYLWYSETQSEEDNSRHLLEETLKQAVDNDFEGFEINFYPVMWKGETAIVEGRLSYCDDRVGLVDNNEIIEMAEYLGIMSEIGRRILYAGMEMAHKLADSNLKVMIPISSVQILASRSVDTIVASYRKWEIDPSKMILAVSETIEFRDYNKAVAVMEILRAHGFAIALTDFGTGQMTMSKIIEYGAKYVAVDSDYMRNKHGEKYEKTVTEALIAYAEQSDIKLILEKNTEHGNTCYVENRDETYTV